jgi:hypothetical protein
LSSTDWNTFNSGVNIANTATSANVASTIVKRDTSGNFTAGAITASSTLGVGGSVGANTQAGITATSASNVGLVVRGAASQTADILDVFNNSGAVLFNINSAGNVGIATSITVALPNHPLTMSLGGNGSGTSIDWNRVIGGIGETDFYNFAQAGAGGFIFVNYSANGSTYTPGSSPTNLVYFDSGGNVTLEQAGSHLIIGSNSVCSTSGCTSSSDARLKEKIQPLHNSLENILKLRGVSYTWKEPETYGKGPQVGLIAQELEKVYPQVVQTDPKSGLKSVAYDHLVAPIIEAIKSIVSRFSGLEDDLSDLKAKNQIQNQKIQQLEKEIAAKNRQFRSLESYLCSKDPHAVFCQ